MQVAVNRSLEVRANQLRGFEVELEAADQIDIESVESREQRLQSEPAPARDTSAQALAPALGALVVHRHAIVVMQDFNRGGVGRDLVELLHEAARPVNEIEADFDER